MKKKAPIDCNEDEHFRIRKTSKDVGEYWTLVDGEFVVFGEIGKAVSMPIPLFKRLLKFLQTPQVLKPKRN